MPCSNYIPCQILPIIPIIRSDSEFIYIPQFDQWPHQAASQLLFFLLHISQPHLLSKLTLYSKSQNTNPHDLLTPISEYLNVALSSDLSKKFPYTYFPMTPEIDVTELDDSYQHCCSGNLHIPAALANSRFLEKTG